MVFSYDAKLVIIPECVMTLKLLNFTYNNNNN